MRSEVTGKTVNLPWSCGLKGQEVGAESQGWGRKNKDEVALASFQGREGE